MSAADRVLFLHQTSARFTFAASCSVKSSRCPCFPLGSTLKVYMPFCNVVMALAVLSLSGAVHPSSLAIVLLPCLTCRWSYRSLELCRAVLATRNHAVGAVVRVVAQPCFY